MIELVKVIMLKGEKGDAGSSGDYAGLTNKPSINGVTLNGNKTAEDLNLAESSQVYTRDQVYRKDETYNKSEVYSKSEVYAKGDSFPDWYGNWEIQKVSNSLMSLYKAVRIQADEDCYLWAYNTKDGAEAYVSLVGAEPKTMSSFEKYLPLMPLKAGASVYLNIPPLTTDFEYALIPTIG